jgi:hypothetical protein
VASDKLFPCIYTRGRRSIINTLWNNRTHTTQGSEHDRVPYIPLSSRNALVLWILVYEVKILGSLGWKTRLRKTIQDRIASATSLMLDTPVFRALMRCSWRMGYMVPDHVRYPELYESYYSPDGPEGVDNRTTNVNTRNEFI